MLGKEGVEISEARDGQEVTIILDDNPFHAEGGGQLSDTGVLCAAEGKAQVTDAQALPNGLVYLIAEITEGVLRTGDAVDIAVDKQRHMNLARNHTATHLLQAALRKVLGNHVNQAGSLVTSDHLRFDFTHFSPVTQDELDKIEALVNEEILKAVPVTIEEMALDAAKEKGAMALFGENTAISSALSLSTTSAANSAAALMWPTRRSSVRSALPAKPELAPAYAVSKPLPVRLPSSWLRMNRRNCSSWQAS